MSFEEYIKIMNIQYNLLSGLSFDDCIVKNDYTIFKSNIITDNFWNIAVLNKEELSDKLNILTNIEDDFIKINRQPSIYINKMLEGYTDIKKHLLNNGYLLNDIDSYMVFEKSKINIEVKEPISLVKTKEEFNDFMEVLESAYSGEVTPENPYSGTITKEYYDAIFRSLNSNYFNHIILYKGNIPVSVATLSYKNGYGVINNVGTRKEFQNLGLGKQLISACINKFNELGGGTLFLFTEHMSKNEMWYEKLGFKTMFVNEQYVKNLK